MFGHNPLVHIGEEVRYKCEKCGSLFIGPSKDAGVMNCPFCRGPPMKWQERHESPTKGLWRGP